MEDPSAGIAGLEKHLLRAAQRIMRPLVRILLRNGISAVVFQELARKVFVDVAFDEFEIEGRQQTLTRVSVLTGLNRKEVARLHNMANLDESDRAWWNRAAAVLAAWTTDPVYNDAFDVPLVLPFLGDAPSFSSLVKTYSGDMYPRAVADELLRLGAIEDVGGQYRMSKRGYVPGSDPALMIDILGLDTAEFIQTIDHNISAPEDDKLLQLKVLANNLPAAHLQDFNVYSRRVAHGALEDIAGWLNERDAGKDHSGTDARYAVGVGIFQINTKLRREATGDD